MTLLINSSLYTSHVRDRHKQPSFVKALTSLCMQLFIVTPRAILVVIFFASPRVILSSSASVNHFLSPAFRAQRGADISNLPC